MLPPPPQENEMLSRAPSLQALRYCALLKASWCLDCQPEPCSATRYDHDGLKYNQDKHRQITPAKTGGLLTAACNLRFREAGHRELDQWYGQRAPWRSSLECFIPVFAGQVMLLRSTAFDFTTKGILQAPRGRRSGVCRMQL